MEKKAPLLLFDLEKRGESRGNDEGTTLWQA
jgi:hypothetical protein